MTLNFDVVRGQLDRDTTRFATATTANVTRFVRERLADAADAGGRRMIATSQSEVANQAMGRFAQLLYDRRDDGGGLWNVASDWRVLIPMPWSSTRYADFGLTDHTRRVLRVAYLATCATLSPRQHWIIYNAGSWYVNRRFATLDDARVWLGANPLTPDLWQTATDATPRRGRKARR